MQVDSFAARRRADQHARPVAPLEPSFRRNQSELEDTDYSLVIQDLTNSEVALQATISLTSRINSLPTLLR